jgi:hypothetical protein
MLLLLALFPQVVFCHDDSGGSSVPVIIEVINQHFTVGRQISSTYLKVFADRTVECQTLKFTGNEPNVVKNGRLTQEEFRQMEAVLSDPDLRIAKARYELTHSVMDSWMEWNIRIPRGVGTQVIAIADFGSTPLRIDGFYPRSVLRLGCMISKVRDKLSSDEPARRRSECEKMSSAK